MRRRPLLPERALVANLDVFTAPELDPRVHVVRSWAWGDGRPAAAVLADLEQDAARALRALPEGAEIAAAYVGGKTVLRAGGPRAAVRALPWLLGELRRAHRVLVGVPPAEGRDRVLWLAIVAGAALTRRPLFFYSETWLPATGAANAGHRLVDRMLAARAATILVPGRAQAEHYRRLGRGAKVRTIRSPYGSAVLGRRIARRDADPPELLFVGRPMPLKGLDRLLDLVDKLDAEGRRVRLVALLHDPRRQFDGGAPGYAARCRERLRARDPALTEVHDERVDVEAFYRRASVLVVPNRIVGGDKVPAESWGRIVPEALAAGVPVVGTDAVPSAVEHVADGENGAVVAWDDDRALAAAVRGWLPS